MNNLAASCTLGYTVLLKLASLSTAQMASILKSKGRSGSEIVPYLPWSSWSLFSSSEHPFQPSAIPLINCNLVSLIFSLNTATRDHTTSSH